MNKENERFAKEKKIPRHNGHRPLSVPKSQQNKVLSSKTPNFGRISPQGVVHKAQISKKSADFIFDDSLDFSDISDRGKFAKNQNFPKDFSKNQLETDSKLNKHIEKYDKAFCILQSNFLDYRDDTEKKIENLQEEIAVVKNNLKNPGNLKNSINDLIDLEVCNAKSELQSFFKSFLKTIEKVENEKAVNEKPPSGQGALTRIQKIREEYDTRLEENEKYLQDLQKKNEVTRSKSRDCSDLMQENKSLREELSKLWHNH